MCVASLLMRCTPRSRIFVLATHSCNSFCQNSQFISKLYWYRCKYGMGSDYMRWRSAEMKSNPMLSHANRCVTDKIFGRQIARKWYVTCSGRGGLWFDEKILGDKDSHQWICCIFSALPHMYAAKRLKSIHTLWYLTLQEQEEPSNLSMQNLGTRHFKDQTAKHQHNPTNEIYKYLDHTSASRIWNVEFRASALGFVLNSSKQEYIRRKHKI